MSDTLTCSLLRTGILLACPGRLLPGPDSSPSAWRSRRGLPTSQAARYAPGRVPLMRPRAVTMPARFPPAAQAARPGACRRCCCPSFSESPSPLASLGTARMRKGQLIAAIEEEAGKAGRSQVASPARPQRRELRGSRSPGQEPLAHQIQTSDNPVQRGAPAGAGADRTFEQDAMEPQTSTQPGLGGPSAAGSGRLAPSDAGIGSAPMPCRGATADLSGSGTAAPPSERYAARRRPAGWRWPAARRRPRTASVGEAAGGQPRVATVTTKAAMCASKVATQARADASRAAATSRATATATSRATVTRAAVTRAPGVTRADVTSRRGTVTSRAAATRMAATSRQPRPRPAGRPTRAAATRAAGRPDDDRDGGNRRSRDRFRNRNTQRRQQAPRAWRRQRSRARNQRG